MESSGREKKERKASKAADQDKAELSGFGSTEAIRILSTIFVQEGLCGVSRRGVETMKQLALESNLSLTWRREMKRNICYLCFYERHKHVSKIYH